MACNFGGFHLYYTHYFHGFYAIVPYLIQPEPPVRSNEWVLDSGATDHCTNTRNWLENIRPVSPKVVTFANGERTLALLGGTANADRNGFRVNDVLYLPGTTYNLLSIPRLTDSDHTVVFRNSGCEVYDAAGFEVEGRVKAVGRRAENGQYILTSREPQPVDQTLWHRRLGHIGMTDLLLLQNGLAMGILFTTDVNIIMCSVNNCPDYVIRPAVPANQPQYDLIIYPRATRILQIVYFYWSGPYEASLDGYRYFVVFIDDYSRKCFVYFFKNHTELSSSVLQFKNDIEHATNLQIGVMKTAHDPACLKRDPIKMKRFMAKNNIRYQHAFIMNDIINETRFRVYDKMLTLLKDAKMNFMLWAEAVTAVIHLANITPNKAFTHMTPEEMWSGAKPDVSLIKVFGCTGYSNTHKRIFVHLWYNMDCGLYHLLDPNRMERYYDSNVDFYEDHAFFNNP